MIYLIVILITFISAWIYQRACGSWLSQPFFQRKGHLCFRTQPLKQGMLFFFILQPIIWLSGLRYGISVDYINVYEAGFYRVLSSRSTGTLEFEPGFLLLIKLCASIIEEPWFMFLVVATITITLFINALRKKSVDFFASVVLFFALGIYFDTFNGIRQYIAVAIFIYSFESIQKKQFWKFTLLMIVASLFHGSALIIIPFYCLSKCKIPIIYWLTIIVVLIVSQSQLYNAFVWLLSQFDKYNEYILRNTLDNYIEFSTSGVLITCVVAFCSIFVEKKMQQTAEGRFLFNMIFVGLAVASVSGIIPLAERILYYFKSLYLFAIPFACQFFRKKYQKVILWGVTGLFAGMTFMGILFMDWYAVIPYQSIFGK